MSKNPVFDTIEDEIIKALELGICLPQEMKLRLPNLHFKALAEALVYADSQTPLPDDCTRCCFHVAGIYVIVASDSDTEAGLLH
jgi:hypothetical protein